MSVFRFPVSVMVSFMLGMGFMLSLVGYSAWLQNGTYCSVNPFCTAWRNLFWAGIASFASGCGLTFLFWRLHWE